MVGFLQQQQIFGFEHCPPGGVTNPESTHWFAVQDLQGGSAVPSPLDQASTVVVVATHAKPAAARIRHVRSLAPIVVFITQPSV